MRKIFIVFASVWLASCLSESGVSPGTTNTFIRYFNGGNNDEAHAMEVTPDGGYIIAATTKIQKAEADKPVYKIKLIKTDQNGNPVWTALYPDFNTKDIDYMASGLQLLPNGGYVVTGDYIYTDPVTQQPVNKVLVLTVDDAGVQKSMNHFFAMGAPSASGPASGKAVTVDGAGNLLVLSSFGTENMFLSQIDANNFTSYKWVIGYSAGTTALANKLFVDENGKILWSGVATKNGLTGIRMVKTGPNTINTDFDLLVSVPQISEVGTDFCRFGYGYAVTGSTNQKGTAATPGTDTDILFKRLAPDGTVLSTKSFPLDDPENGRVDSQNDIGNSINSTSDGGLILLSSVNSVAIGGRGDTDFYLIKIDAFGEKIWAKSFGSRFKDDGIAVRQAPDGGFVVLGTTTQGGVKLLVLAKTDKDGKID